jgi:hypothetical protein
LQAWKEYYLEFCKQNGTDPNSEDLVYELKKHYCKFSIGSYVDPRLIDFVAIWANPKYAVNVGRLLFERNENSKS